MGRETAQLKLHQRCIDLLDMAITAKNRQLDTKRRLDLYIQTKDPYHPIRLMNTLDEIEQIVHRWGKVYNRIMISYQECFDRLERVQKLSTAHALQLTNKLS
jgi:hypothetical protein